MALDPTISLQAGRPPQGGEAGAGTGLMTQNLLSQPSQLNALLQMSGSIAAGKALQGAIDPQTGAFSQAAFAKALAANPAAAINALDSMNKGLTAGKSELEQAITRRKAMQQNLTSLLIDPKMKSDPEYANQMYNSKLKELVDAGVINPQTAAVAASSKPVNQDGQLDTTALDLQLKQHLFSTLSPVEQQVFKYGNTVLVDNGKMKIPVRIGPEGMTLDPTNAIPNDLTPGEAITPYPGNVTPGGRPTTEPGAVRAPEAGVGTTPMPSGSPNPGFTVGGQPSAPAKPNVSLPSATGYLPTNPQARAWIANTWPKLKSVEDLNEAIGKLDDDTKAQIVKWIGAKTKSK